MATQRVPVYLTNVPTQFNSEDALLIDFGSATDHPFTIKVGGNVYFTCERDGSFRIEEHLVWNVDRDGNVGEQYDYRPDFVNAYGAVRVGAISGTGDGARLTLNRLALGHGNVDKYIDADQGTTFTPAIRYNATHQRWEYTHDGVVYVAFGASLVAEPYVAATSGEAFSIGDALYLHSDGKVYRTDADIVAASRFYGFAKDAATGADEAIDVYTGGLVVVNTDLSGDNPGEYVYLSTSPGLLTTTAPVASGDTALRVGIVYTAAVAGAAWVLVQVGEPFLNP